MGRVARQPVATAKRGNSFAQQPFGLLQPLFLVAAPGEPFEELLNQSRNGGAPLGSHNSGMPISGVVQ